MAIDRAPQGIDIDSVLTDNREASVRAVEHLIAHGHTRIAFIGGLAHLTTEQERHAGYVDAMTAAGLRIDPVLVHHGAADAEQARAIAGAMLDQPQPPTAIFSGQNLITMGCVRALRERGLRHSVALLGFDDFAMADLLDPPVSVVAQDARGIGRRAAELLFARMVDFDLPTGTYIVPATLIARGSGEITAP